MTKRRDTDSIAGMIGAMRDDPPSREEIDEILLRLERAGKIRRTGEFRDGEPVFVATKLQ